MLHSNRLIVFSIDALLIICCVMGIMQSAERANLPFELRESGSQLMTNFQNPGRFDVRVDSIRGYPISAIDEAEFIFDGMRIGQQVRVSLGGRTEVVALVKSYSRTHMATQVAVLLIFLFFGIFVFFKRPDEQAALLAHNISIAVTLVVALTWGNYVLFSQGIGQFLRLMFYVGECLASVSLVHFALRFPHGRPLSLRGKVWIRILYTSSALLILWCGYTSYLALASGSLTAFRSNMVAFQAMQLYFSVCSMAMAALFIRSYRNTRAKEERQKLKWALLGISVGLFSYVLLWQIPQLLRGEALVSEDVLLLLVAIAPVTFAISILRYRLLDIDTVLRRATVYAAIISVLLLVYTVALLLVSKAFPELYSSAIVVVAGSVLLAVLFQPLRSSIERIVDKHLFHVRYNYRQVQQTMLDAIGHAVTSDELEQSLLSGLKSLFNPEYIRSSRTTTHNSIAIAERALERGIQADTPNTTDSAIIGISTNYESLKIAMGDKPMHERYSSEDYDLLRSIQKQSVLALDRIGSHEQMIQERIAADRERELGRLKSLFVSSVSHDLKTPITSIKMFAQLLAPDVPAGKGSEYIKIIEGESDRLTGLIDNVLSFSRSERGIMRYDSQIIDLASVTEKVLSDMQYLFNLEGMTVSSNLADQPQYMLGDAAALERAIGNLLSNAVKYSGDSRSILIDSWCEADIHLLRIQDVGYGIAQDDILHIFEPFYRSDSTAGRATGVGLGLFSVNHITEAHGGTIDCVSEIGVGTTFTLKFPRYNHDAEDLDH